MTKLMSKRKLLRIIKKYINDYYIPEETSVEESSDDALVADKAGDIREGAAMPPEQMNMAGQPSAKMAMSSTMLFGRTHGKQSDRTASLDSFMIKELIDRAEETFSVRLLRMIDERGLRDSDVYNKVGIDRRLFSKIRNNEDYSPKKDTVFLFSISMKLSLDDTKDLMNSAGYAISRSSKRDIVIAGCIDNKVYDLFRINEILEEFGLKVLV